MTIYFDNAATTRPCSEAVAAMTEMMTEEYGNPSSGHALGRQAAARLEEARERVAGALGAKPGEILFTSGGTESDNWALRSGAYLMRHRGKHIITGAAEHDAIRQTVKALEGEGWEVTWLKPDRAGRVTPGMVLDALRDDTALISLMLVNNELGSVSPIGEIAAAVRQAGSKALFHTDAVQGFLKVPFTPAGLGVDLITVSSHKIHGPKGAGALWVRQGVRLPGLLTGGGQEKTLRPGTEAMPALAAFGAAAEAGRRERDKHIAAIREVKEYTLSLLWEKLPGILVLGESDAPHIVNISLPGYRSEVLMNWLDREGICVSKSSACKKGARSHVLEAMDLPADVIDGAIRLSFSRYNTREEAEIFAEKLAEAATRLRTAKR